MTDSPRDAATDTAGTDFIRQIIDDDLADGHHDGRVVTRFPPEPNGYLHIGHAKAICLNFGIAEDYADRAATRCHLRFDDTNPTTESEAYAASIREAVRWLGFEWDDLYYASDYFERLYAYAVQLIRQGDAYVDSQNEEAIRKNRGTVTEPGVDSPYRTRSVKVNLDLFERMRAGEFEEGAHVLRAKIDMGSPHMILRDPLLYRIRHAHHYRTGDDWCIYPMYDYAHCLEDAIEGVTHSLCTLEFDNNRRVYDWVLEHCLPTDELDDRPHQYEFSRLNLDYTVMSKRKLLELVEGDYVDGWDDPRLPTVLGLRRRGVRPSAIRAFCDAVGVTRTEGRVEISLLEHAIRDDLNYVAPRVMAVLDPLKVTVTNFPEGDTDWIEAPYWPHDVPREGSRRVPFTRTLYVERDDFREDPPDGFYRLAPGREVRLRYGYFITCDEVVRDASDRVVELRCSYDPKTRGGDAPDGRNPRGTIHWVSATEAVPLVARLYDRLFDVPAPEDGAADYKEHLNPASLVTQDGFAEPAVRDHPPATRFQFERQGYFWPDPEDSAPLSDAEGALVFNQIVSLRDTWARREQEATHAEQEARRREKEALKDEQRRLAAARRHPTDALDPEQEARYDRLLRTYDLDEDDAAVLAADEAVARFYEQAVGAYDAPQSVANWVVNDLMRARKDRALADLRVDPEALAALARLTDDDVVSTRAAREVFDEMLETGRAPETIVDARSLRQLDDRDALRQAVETVVAQHPDEAERYRAGKKGLIGFFMGRVMAATRGTANPELARQLLQDALAGG